VRSAEVCAFGQMHPITIERKIYDGAWQTSQ